MRPYYKKFYCDTETPVTIFSKLTSSNEYCFLFESAEQHAENGHYSMLGFGALSVIECPAGGDANPLDVLKKAYDTISYTPSPDLPRLQASFVGYFAYETVRHLEKLSLPLKDAHIPEALFFFPKNLIIFDHREHTITLIAYSAKDLDALMARVESAQESKNSSARADMKEHVKADAFLKDDTHHTFKKTVERLHQAILSGEVFQTVISQNFTASTDRTPFELYRRLRLLSPSPYMFYLHYPDFSIIGSSPETLVRTEGSDVIIRPIAGTRARGETLSEDARLAEELKRDPKEKAEHMMLVDLARNDIGRVSQAGSVRIPRLMEVEKFSHVMHLVSEVRGTRSHDASLFDIFRAAFPAGTLTGAPKIRAMELIAELERTPRGIYGGAVGYFDLSGEMDFAIAIRTMLYKKGAVSLRAGAGIVYDSIPRSEHQECLNKARGPLATLV